MSSDTFHNQVNRYFAAIRALDVEAWLATFAEGAVSEDPYGSPPHEGKAALGQFFNGLASAFESVDMRADHIFISGNAAAVKFTIAGKGKNGRDVKAEGIEVFEFDEEGLIKRIRAYWNPAAMIAELQS
ncbi:MAG TPA: nuclear transport factor 2 family protein [Blastocatellia bacterium]|jgi:steroid delta-isomerase